MVRCGNFNFFNTKSTAEAIILFNIIHLTYFIINFRVNCMKSKLEIDLSLHFEFKFQENDGLVLCMHFTQFNCLCYNRKLSHSSILSTSNIPNLFSNGIMFDVVWKNHEKPVLNPKKYLSIWP